MSPRGWLLLALILSCLAVVIAADRSRRASRESDEEAILFEGRRALAEGRYLDARQEASHLTSAYPSLAQAWILAAHAATELDDPAAAVEYYRQVPRSAGDDYVGAMCDAGNLCLDLHRAGEAEVFLNRALTLAPRNTVAHRGLASLYCAEGRSWESLPHLLELLKQDQHTLDALLMLGNSEQRIDLLPALEKFHAEVPDDPGPIIGLANSNLSRNEVDLAIPKFREALATVPDVLDAQAQLGVALLIAEDYPGLARWNAELPTQAGAHPQIWVVRGQWAQQTGQLESSARCYWEAVRQHPNHQGAVYQLAQILRGLKRPELADQFARRATRLQELVTILNMLFTERKNVPLMREAAKLTEDLGRPWEAWGWYSEILKLDPKQSWAAKERDRVEAGLTVLVQQTLQQSNPALLLDLSDFPLPKWSTPQSAEPSPTAPSSPVQFADVSATAGIKFSYYAGTDKSINGKRMYEFTGGGVAALDYDGDFWPDLYLTQGCRWPPQTDQRDHLDALYRNLGDGTFADVTAVSGIREDRFGQGATVGDFNADGFADLYVANIGLNRLWINQGDGTFADATASSGLVEDGWTTSCLLADLNGDRLPDLYDVNYVQDPDVFERICTTDGRSRACSPNAFNPQPDRLWINQGDGQVVDASSTSGILADGGNGLGIVAADLDGLGGLDLFIANDVDANFLLINLSAPGEVRFQEQAVVQGLAYDRDGKAQACMGVACDDANGDGLVDLYVSNFYHESNTLYVAQGGGSYLDGTIEAGLREPSFDMLGFGTQFLDGELDGRPDLVLTNGHVDDWTDEGIPYRMRSQYFRNLGEGRFAEVPPAELGPFFEAQRLGRGLARLDANRDGREDFCVSYLDAPVALVLNQTPDVGHFLALHLRGTESERDALGAVVRLTAGGQTWVRHLSAGDGYQASNQRILVFGLGRQEAVESVAVLWPTGKEQVYAGLDVDREWLIRENSSQPVLVGANR